MFDGQGGLDNNREKSRSGGQSQAGSSKRKGMRAIFEVSTDPNELTNLYDQREYSDIQEALHALGHYDGRADGKFGPRTAAAQNAWRQSAGSSESVVRLTKMEQIVLLTQAADQSAASKALLGLFVAQGVGYPKDKERGRTLLSEAIAEGFGDAKAWLDQLDNL